MTIITTEVFKKTDDEAGRVERELEELPFDPSELVFGTEAVYSSDDTESSTTSSVYVDPTTRKLRLTTDVVDGESYLLWWYAEIKTNNQNANMEARIQIEDTDTAALPEHDGNLWNPCSGLYRYTATADESINIDIDWRVISGGSATAYIRRARIIIWRAS